MSYGGYDRYWDRFHAGQQALSMDSARTEGINVASALVRIIEALELTDVFDVWEADDGRMMVRIDGQAVITKEEAAALRSLKGDIQCYGVASEARSRAQYPVRRDGDPILVDWP